PPDALRASTSSYGRGEATSRRSVSDNTANKSLVTGRSDRTFNPDIDFAAESAKINWLGQKRLSAVFQRLTLRVCIAVGRDHNNWNVRPHGLCFGQKLEAAHPRHVDVGQNQNKRGRARLTDALQCRRRRLRKFHSKPASSNIV